MMNDPKEVWNDLDLVMISALEHYSYCPRQCALIHLEQTFDENIYTLQGHMLHERVDEEASELKGDVRIERAVPLWSRRLGLVGRADVVEFHGQVPFPVEYKVGPRRKWGHDDLQLCAQALCLEEMTGQSVPRGAIYHHGSRRQREVAFDESLRQRVAEAVADIQQMLTARTLPRAVNDARCHHCSLKDSCLPSVVGEAARVRALHASLFDVDGPPAWETALHREIERLNMRQLLNTLYVTTEGAYLHLDHETLKVEMEGTTKLQVPLHYLGGVVCFGNVMVSPFLLHRCAEDGRALVFLDRHGRFKARVEGPVSGNVLLRHAQHLAASDAEMAIGIARNIVAGKIQNARQIVLRGGREGEIVDDIAPLQECAEVMSNVLIRLRSSRDLDEVRGLEGEAARTYFSVFDRMVREDREMFCLNGRSRRPPLDRMNALLSFLYTLLLSDCVAAVEGVGLDPQIGFLHALRPGRPALALDLMEELRVILADRLALTLVNRRQLSRDDFHERPGGAIHLTDKGRKEVLVAYQKRKQDEVQHPLIDQKVLLGLVPHVQARLLARHLRGDLENYPPFLYR